MKHDNVSTGLTKSERFVTKLCKETFLDLWTHPNPKGKKGKELCDCLIVCDRHIIIISVKESALKDPNKLTDLKRWEKRSIDNSLKQISGAERYINMHNSIKRKDGIAISLPSKDSRTIHRISVSLGGRDAVSVKWGEFEIGFVHVLTEANLEIIFEELNTISDFIHFLETVENYFDGSVKVAIFDGGGIQDLLAIYQMNDKSLNPLYESGKKPDSLLINNDIWPSYERSPDRRDVKSSLKESYAWDDLIKNYTQDLLQDRMLDMHSKQVTSNDLALVAMVLQPRLCRQTLVKVYDEMQKDPKISARAVRAYNRIAFVFLSSSHADHEELHKVLSLHCFVARGIIPDIITVVGIIVDKLTLSESKYATQVCYMYYPDWSEEDNKNALEIQKELGYFRNVSFKHSSS